MSDIVIPTGPIWAAAAAESNWLTYRLIQQPDGKKPIKKPVLDGVPTDPKLCAVYTFEEAQVVAEANRLHLGYLPREGSAMVCVDLDGVLKDYALVPEHAALAEEMLTYETFTEFSPSGTGIHILMARGDLGPILRDRSTEALGLIASEARFFSVSFDLADGAPTDITDAPVLRAALQPHLDRWVEEEREDHRDREDGGEGWWSSLTSEGRAECAAVMLAALPGEVVRDREKWLEVTFALRLWTECYVAWDKWSATSPSNYDPVGNLMVWDGRERKAGRKITIGTLIHMATEAGVDLDRWKSEGTVARSRVQSQRFAGLMQSRVDRGLEPPPFVSGAEVLGFNNDPEMGPELGRTVEQVLAERRACFSSGGQPVYVKGGAVSMMNPETGKLEAEVEWRVVPMTDASFWEVMRYPHVVFMKQGTQNRPPAPAVRMPEPVRDWLVKSGGQLLPPLNAILQAPALLPDGRMLVGGEEAYYDDATGLWVAVPPLRGEALPFSTPAHALAWIESEWLGEFCFESREDMLKSVLAVGSLLTAKTMLGNDAGPPAFVVTAPQASTGKTVLAKALRAACTGFSGSTLSYPAEEEEMRKMLFSTATSQPAGMIFDNVLRGAIVASPVVCQFVTDVQFEQRVLKESNNRSISARSVLFFTGNAIVAGGDMLNRSVTIRLRYVGDGSPVMRRFARRDDIVSWTIANRATIIEAMRVILTAPVARREGFGRMQNWAQAVLFPVCEAANIAPEELLSVWVTESAEDDIVEDIGPLMELMAREGMIQSKLLGAPKAQANLRVGAPVFTINELRDICGEALAPLLGVTRADLKALTNRTLANRLQAYDGLSAGGLTFLRVSANLGERTRHKVMVCFRVASKEAKQAEEG